MPVRAMVKSGHMQSIDKRNINSFRSHEYQVHRRVLLGVATALTIAILQLVARADRYDDFKKLTAEYKDAEQKYSDDDNDNDPTPAEKARLREKWPGWHFLPRFL